MPRISKIIVSGRKEKDLLPLMVKVGRLQIMIIGIITVGFMALGESFVVYIWRKPDFVESYICAVLLIIPSLFYLPMQIANTTLIVENKVKLQATIFANVVLSIPLSKAFGAIGASASICIAYFIRNILMIITHHRVLKLNMLEFYRRTYCKLLPHLLAAMAVGMLCDRFNPIHNVYLNFAVNGAVMVGFYFVIMYLFGFNEYEKDLIFKVFRKFAGRKKRLQG